MDPGSRFACPGRQMNPERQWILPHHARDKSGLAARRLDVFFQEAVRAFFDVSRPRIGPGPTLVVVDTGGLAGFVALAVVQSEIAVVAAEPVDRGFDRAVARLDHAGAAHARDAAIILGAGRDSALQPAYRATSSIGRVVEAPGPAASVALAHQRTIGRIARGDRRALIVAARTIEIGLRLRRPRGASRHQKGERHDTRPEQAASPHSILLS